MPGTSPLRAWWARRPPAAGAAVMATGVLSAALYTAGDSALSLAALALACAVWPAFVALCAWRLLRARAVWAAQARTPAALTGAAGTALLGTGFALHGAHLVAAVLLAGAALLWAGLLVPVLRAGRRPASGPVFLGCAATEGLALPAAVLARAEQTPWLAHAAMALFWLGVALYVLALTRFDPRQVTEGRGDQWLAGGALALAALAGAQLLAAAGTRMYLWDSDDDGVLRSVTVTLLVLALCWYVVLLAAELAWPRLRYDERRWSTVFSLGATGAAVLSVAAVLRVPSLTGSGQVLLWIAVAAWAAVAAATVARAHTECRADR
ncbi:hypothetical protein [Streptomyces tropicalis]|uniref:Integral membrane protein n=1 Tax=Streptomyces tropicalis TaxID=3034234 RepID=A0ABT6A8V5_9ACTN|nr:hypothetical protein [Streptomyces tropicalis]MDF3301073.1 hypothetical protein [Streptomyces tropicalis]